MGRLRVRLNIYSGYICNHWLQKVNFFIVKVISLSYRLFIEYRGGGGNKVFLSAISLIIKSE